MDPTSCSSWLEIDLNKFRSNIQRLQEFAGCPVMAVLKANGYGHGIVPVSRAARQAGSPWLGVARYEEAELLRQNGDSGPILVLGYTPPDRACDAAKAGVSLAVYDRDLAQEYEHLVSQAGLRLKVHAKIDTGMGRLGIFWQEGQPFLRFLAGLPHLDIEGIFTHFARADEPDVRTTDEQIERFEKVLALLEKDGLLPGLVHAANSAGSIYYPAGRYDFVRSGIAMFGLHPSPKALLPEGFQPALTWKARLTSVKTYPPNHGISYNHRYTTSRRERIGAIAAGYADGFRRCNGNMALVSGQRVPVVGVVCMDQSMLQLDGVDGAEVGDEVVLIGQQGTSRITAEDVAAAWGTINYEVVCGLADRLPRIYIDR